MYCTSLAQVGLKKYWPGSPPCWPAAPHSQEPPTLSPLSGCQMRQFLPAVPTKQHSLPLPLCSLIQVAASIKVSYIRLSLVIGVFGGGHTCCFDALFCFYFLTHLFFILHHLLHSWWHGGVFISSPNVMHAFYFILNFKRNLN